MACRQQPLDKFVDPERIFRQLIPGRIVSVQLGGLYSLTQGMLTREIANYPSNELFFNTPREKKGEKRIKQTYRGPFQELGFCRPCCIVRPIAGTLVEIVPGTSSTNPIAQQASPLLVQPGENIGLPFPTFFVTGQRRVVDCRRFVLVPGTTDLLQYGQLSIGDFKQLLDMLRRY